MSWSLPLRAALLLLTATAGLQAQSPRDDKAEQAYLAGARLVDRQQFAQAQTEFARAVTLAPTRNDYLLALNLTRQHRVSDLVQQAAKARLSDDTAHANTLLAEARTIDPTSELLVPHPDPAIPVPPTPRTRITPTPEPSYAAPIQLAPTPGHQNMHLRGDTRQIVTQAALLYGIRTIFDDSVTAQNLRFDLEEVPYSQAMPILLRMAHLFAVPITSTSVMVVKDTEENRQKFERQVEESVYVPGSTTEQLNELSNIIKNVFDVKQVVVSPTSGTITLRAPEATIKAVNYTIADLMDGGAEVELQLRLVSIDKNHTRNIGGSPPTSFNVTSPLSELQKFVAANQSILNTAKSLGFTPTGTPAQILVEEAAFLVKSGLATDANLTNVIRFFGGGLTLFAVGVNSGANYNFALNSSEARALDDITVRIGDHQTTTLRVGEKYPITTSTYSSGVSSAASSALAGVTVNGVSAQSLLNQVNSIANSVAPMIQYEDLGITLKTTPTVLKSGLIAIHVDLKLESLTGAAANNIPVLTSRAFTSDITIPEGSTAVMLSDLSRTESGAISGLPGLSSLPGFQGTIDDKLREVDSSELVLLVTPRLVRRRSATMASRPFAFTTSVPQDN